jgi:hypothetical protein
MDILKKKCSKELIIELLEKLNILKRYVISIIILGYMDFGTHYTNGKMEQDNI